MRALKIADWARCVSMPSRLPRLAALAGPQFSAENYNSGAQFFRGPAGYHMNSHTNALVPHGNTSATRPCTLQGIGAAHCDALQTSRA